jgi:hypothetical protein
MKLKQSFVMVGLVFGLTLACKSKAEQCMETTEETYKREVAACADDACKKKAEESKIGFMDACKELK